MTATLQLQSDSAASISGGSAKVGLAMRGLLSTSLGILSQAMLLAGCCSDSSSQTRRLRLKVAPSFSGPVALVVMNGTTVMDAKGAYFECTIDERGIGSIPNETGLDAWLDVEFVDALGREVDGRLIGVSRYARIENEVLWGFVGSLEGQRDWFERNSNPWVQRDWLVGRGIEMLPEEGGQPR